MAVYLMVYFYEYPFTQLQWPSSITDSLSPLLVHYNERPAYKSYFRFMIFIWNIFWLSVQIFYASSLLISHVDN
jgi:hypothetical protein